MDFIDQYNEICPGDLRKIPICRMRQNIGFFPYGTTGRELLRPMR